jgi:hypothetical protein
VEDSTSQLVFYLLHDRQAAVLSMDEYWLLIRWNSNTRQRPIAPIKRDFCNVLQRYLELVIDLRHLKFIRTTGMKETVRGRVNFTETLVFVLTRASSSVKLIKQTPFLEWLFSGPRSPKTDFSLTIMRRRFVRIPHSRSRMRLCDSRLRCPPVDEHRVCDCGFDDQQHSSPASAR